LDRIRRPQKTQSTAGILAGSCMGRLANKKGEENDDSAASWEYSVKLNAPFRLKLTDRVGGSLDCGILHVG